MNAFKAFLRNHAGALVSAGALLAAAGYLGTRTLVRSSRRVPLASLPRSSAIKNFVENTGKGIDRKASGLDSSRLLSSWHGGEAEDKTHWIPSFVALQTKVPVSILAKYSLDNGGSNNSKNTLDLAQKFIAAFLDARAADPEAYFLDKDVPPLEFTAGHRLFGREMAKPVGAFLLDTWSSTKSKPVAIQSLATNAPAPVSEFPSNQAVLSPGEDAAGAVMYWKCAETVTKSVDVAASCGLPWRVMRGGFQEFIVERVAEDTAKLTYACVEVSELHPRRKLARDFKKMPRVLFELHVLYARWLLYNTVRKLLNLAE